MSDDVVLENDDRWETTPTVESVHQTMEQFFDTAGVDRVYGEPLEYGDTVVIPAAEVLTAMGFGVGAGSGQSDMDEAQSSGGGGGGGGGGRTLSRPVAVIIASPTGIRVEPVVDPTKIALAAITASGFMLATMLRMLRRNV